MSNELDKVLFRMDKAEKKKLKIRIINLNIPSIQDYLNRLIKLDEEKGLIKPDPQK